MGDDDERAFAPVEIGDLNAVDLEVLQGHRCKGRRMRSTDG